MVKRYRRAPANAVGGIAFDVPAGQMFCLLGPNGDGKTTTVSILTTTLAPTSGSVRIAGHDLLSQRSQVRRDVGIVFQQPSLDLNLIAEEDIRLHAVLYGLYPWRPLYRLMPQRYRGQARDLADVLGIADALWRPARALSGGMRRKLEIVRALMHQPRVLFLDEPSAGLDPQSRRSLWAYLTETRNRYRTTVFLTTHYLEEAEAADAVCVLATISALAVRAAARREFQAMAAIAWRDVTKLLRDRPRLAVNLAFPVLLIAGLGSVLQPTAGKVTGLSAVTLAFTGVFAATLFQSTAAGMISIIQDRETDFSRELFVTPVWRLTLLAGKIAGESAVAFCQAGLVAAFAVAAGVRMTAAQFAALLPPAVACCLLGGAFGLATIAALWN